MISLFQTQSIVKGQHSLVFYVLYGSILLVSSAIVIVIIHIGHGANASNGMPLSILGTTECLFVISLVISRTGRIKLASCIILVIYYLLATYSDIIFTALLAQTWLLFVLVITLSMALTSPRAGVVITIIISLTLVVVSSLQSIHFIHPNLEWTSKALGDELIPSLFLLAVITLIAWSRAQETITSLHALEKSQQELKIERDLLDTRVAQKTKELQVVQAEKIQQFYQFASFGRIASGIIHDLSSPLTSVALSLEEMKATTRSNTLTNAILGAKKLKQYIDSARRQINQPEKHRRFSVKDELMDVISLLIYRSRRSQVKIITSLDDNIFLIGDAIKLRQVLANLISNAIDAYSSVSMVAMKREVVIQASSHQKGTTISIEDFGSGIATNHMQYIFDPFYSTKLSENSLGLGLVIVKDIIENDFHGNIDISTTVNVGTKFIINIPC